MELNKKINKKIKIVTVLLSVEILFLLLSLSATSIVPIVGIIIASILIYLIRKLTKNSYNSARVLLLMIFLASARSANFTVDSQYPTLSIVLYAFQIALWVIVFFLTNSIYRQLFSKITSVPKIESLQSLTPDSQVSPKILIWIFATPLAIGLLIAAFSWAFNSN